jgi:hypothetical protein
MASTHLLVGRLVERRKKAGQLEWPAVSSPRERQRWARSGRAFSRMRRAHIAVRWTRPVEARSQGSNSSASTVIGVRASRVHARPPRGPVAGDWRNASSTPAIAFSAGAARATASRLAYPLSSAPDSARDNATAQTAGSSFRRDPAGTDSDADAAIAPSAMRRASVDAPPTTVSASSR